MALAPRALTVEYGSITVGSTSRPINTFIQSGQNEDRSFVEFSFDIFGADSSALNSEANTVETAFRTPNKKLKMLLGGSTWLEFDPDTNTGFNQRPEITKRQELGADTGRSRRYFVRIDFELPANVQGSGGRRDNTRVDITFSPSQKRTVTFTGTYTALGSEDSARAQYESEISSYTSGLLSSFGGTWEKIDESQTADEHDKILDFRIVFKEIIAKQSSSGAPDDPDIFDHRLFISQRIDAPGDTPIAERLSTINLNYTASIKKGVDLRSKYNSSIREFLIGKAISIFNAGSVALINEEPQFEESESTINVRMTLLSVIGKSGNLEFEETLEIEEDFGLSFAPAWTGDPLEYFIYQGHKKVIRTVSQRKRVLGFIQANREEIGPIDFSGQLAFFPLSRRQSTTQKRLGTPARHIDITDITTTTMEQLMKPIRQIETGTPTLR